MKRTGILLPVSSLPSDHGCGDLGKYAYEFLDLLSDSGITIWQILPLNPMGYGNSPYQPYSSFAGDEIYISLEVLREEGLLKEVCPPYRECASSVDYEAVRAYKEPYYRQAFLCFGETDEYREFASQPWVLDYGVFRAFKKINEGRCWNEWPDEQKTWPEQRTLNLEPFMEEIRYQMFLQYLFFRQWMEVRRYAAERGILIMGDVPFYVGLDSQDVWAGKKNFLLKEDGTPSFIAGVPPDYFSATGQRWGNPVYDWDHLKADEYRFWVDRIGYNSRLFDLIRIDHFRAFDTFWKIPVTCPTAVEGEWIEAPGYEALDTILREVPDAGLVAEDLGELRPEVTVLKEHYGFKGMKILQFTLYSDGKYVKDHFKDQENMIIYTGTHDNTTLRAWYEEQSVAGRRKLRRFLAEQGFRQGSVMQRLMEYTLNSPAEYAVLPMADVLELDAGGRLNSPGTVGSPNWEWKLTDFAEAGRRMRWVRRQVEKHRQS